MCLCVSVVVSYECVPREDRSTSLRARAVHTVVAHVAHRMPTPHQTDTESGTCCLPLYIGSGVCTLVCAVL